MKIKLFTALITAFVFTSENFCQLSFGVSPGFGLNSTYFGYKVNEKVVPFIGFQYLNAKFKTVESGQEFDYDLNQVVSYSNESDFSGSVYIPHLGVKYFIKQQNKINAYFSLSISKPLLSGKIKNDGEINEDFKDEIKNTSLWGSEFGFGIEYFLDENFSIGGEFGLRYLHLKYLNTIDDEFYNPNTGEDQATEIENEFKLNFSPTFSKIALNFYF